MGEELLAFLLAIRLPAAIFYARLPDMDGYTLVRQVRARGAERGGNIPAIAQTGYATQGDRKRALSSGYQMFLGKPLDMDELILRYCQVVS
jgi:CheY-like chemotaxis protein